MKILLVVVFGVIMTSCGSRKAEVSDMAETIHSLASGKPVPLGKFLQVRTAREKSDVDFKEEMKEGGVTPEEISRALDGFQIYVSVPGNISLEKK